MGRKVSRYLWLLFLASAAFACDAFSPPTPPAPIPLGSLGSGGRSAGTGVPASGGRAEITFEPACEDVTSGGPRVCGEEARGLPLECIVTPGLGSCGGGPYLPIGEWAMEGLGGGGGLGGEGGEAAVSGAFVPVPVGACPAHTTAECRVARCVDRARLLADGNIECCYAMQRFPCL